MKQIYNTIKANPLLKGIDLWGFEAMVHCMQGRVLSYTKGAAVQLA